MNNSEGTAPRTPGAPPPGPEVGETAPLGAGLEDLAAEAMERNFDLLLHGAPPVSSSSSPDEPTLAIDASLLRTLVKRIPRPAKGESPVSFVAHAGRLALHLKMSGGPVWIRTNHPMNSEARGFSLPFNALCSFSDKVDRGTVEFHFHADTKQLELRHSHEAAQSLRSNTVRRSNLWIRGTDDALADASAAPSDSLRGGVDGRALRDALLQAALFLEGVKGHAHSVEVRDGKLIVNTHSRALLRDDPRLTALDGGFPAGALGDLVAALRVMEDRPGISISDAGLRLDDGITSVEVASGPRNPAATITAIGDAPALCNVQVDAAALKKALEKLSIIHGLPASGAKDADIRNNGLVDVRVRKHEVFLRLQRDPRQVGELPIETFAHEGSLQDVPELAVHVQFADLNAAVSAVRGSTIKFQVRSHRPPRPSALFLNWDLQGVACTAMIRVNIPE